MAQGSGITKKFTDQEADLPVKGKVNFYVTPDTHNPPNTASLKLHDGTIIRIGTANDVIQGTAATFAALPPAAAHAGEIYIVEQSTGIYLLNRKQAGLYMSDGVNWTRIGNNLLWFDDQNFELYNGVDPTKKLKFNVGSLPGSTTVTWSMLPYSGTVAVYVGSPAANQLLRFDGTNWTPIDLPVTNSIELDGSGNAQLVNDDLAPGNSYYYGTNGAGVKGYYPLPAGGGGVRYVVQANPNVPPSAISPGYGNIPNTGVTVPAGQGGDLLYSCNLDLTFGAGDLISLRVQKAGVTVGTLEIYVGSAGTNSVEESFSISNLYIPGALAGETINIQAQLLAGSCTVYDRQASIVGI